MPIVAREIIGMAAREPLGKLTPEEAVCGFVVMESVTVCEPVPSVTGVDGVKVAFAPAGSGVEGDMLNVTGSENMPLEGERVKANFAVSPAVMAGDELGGATE
jgi:hypothetical protein